MAETDNSEVNLWLKSESALEACAEIFGVCRDKNQRPTQTLETGLLATKSTSNSKVSTEQM